MFMQLSAEESSCLLHIALRAQPVIFLFSPDLINCRPHLRVMKAALALTTKRHGRHSVHI